MVCFRFFYFSANLGLYWGLGKDLSHLFIATISGFKYPLMGLHWEIDILMKSRGPWRLVGNPPFSLSVAQLPWGSCPSAGTQWAQRAGGIYFTLSYLLCILDYLPLCHSVHLPTYSDCTSALLTSTYWGVAGWKTAIANLPVWYVHLPPLAMWFT